MRKLCSILVVFAAACSAAPTPPAQARTEPGGAGNAPLVVLELFQSQGCSSCPPANANVNALTGRSDVLALSFAVTYWDYLGWKDKFAQPAFTERQRAYARTGQSDGVYTPQVVINGSRAVVGASATTLGKAVKDAGTLGGGPSLTRTGDTLAIGPGSPAASAQVLLVTYDPRVRQVPIKAGENTGKPLRIDLPALADPALRRAVLLQQGTGGKLIAAMKL